MMAGERAGLLGTELLGTLPLMEWPALVIAVVLTPSKGLFMTRADSFWEGRGDITSILSIDDAVRVGDDGEVFSSTRGNESGKTRRAKDSATSASDVLAKVDGSAGVVGGVTKRNVTLVVAEMLEVDGSASENSCVSI